MLNFESGTLSDLALSSGRLSEDIFAVIASNDWLGMAENYIGFTASSTLDIHKVGVRGWDKSFKLVWISLVFVGGVK